MYLLGLAVMVNSKERPGAVINMTTEELDKAREEILPTGGKVYVVRVTKLKTANNGSAKLEVDETLHSRIQDYVQLCGKDSGKLFQVAGGGNLSCLAKHMESLSKRFGFTNATSTEVRKAAATRSAYLPEESRNLLAKQLSTVNCQPSTRAQPQCQC